MIVARGGRFALAAALAGVAAASAWAQTRMVNGLLTDEAGLSLYVSEAEPPGKSQCYGACLNMWTPYAAPAGAKPGGDLTLVARDDGTQQWAYKGKPLYRWWNDKKPGDMDGQGLRGGNWHVVRP